MWCYKCTVVQLELINLKYVNPIRSLRWWEHLKDILIFQHYPEFWKLVSQRFWMPSFLWFWCDNAYKWPQLIKSLFEKEIYYSFLELSVMTLCFMYRDFPYLSCLTFFPENFQSVFLETGRAEVNILFVQLRTESKRTLSMSQKMLESRCHVNNTRSSSIMESAWISKEMSTSGCSSEHRMPHEAKG